MAKNECSIPPQALALYDRLLERFPEVVRKGAKSAYTSLNGHMYSFMTQEGDLALRMSPEHLEEFTRRYKAKPCIQYGATMRGYATVPKALLKRTDELAQHFERSLEYIGSLAPKPTTRKKAGAKKKAAKKKSAAKKSAAKKSAAKKSAAKKAAAKKAAAKKKASKRAAKKSAAKKSAAKKKASKQAAKKPAAKKKASKRAAKTTTARKR